MVNAVLVVHANQAIESIAIGQDVKELKFKGSIQTHALDHFKQSMDNVDVVIIKLLLSMVGVVLADHVNEDIK